MPLLNATRSASVFCSAALLAAGASAQLAPVPATHAFVAPELATRAEAPVRLPDSPGFVSAVGESSSAEAPMDAVGYDPGVKQTTPGKMVGPFDKYIQPGEIAPRIGAFDKVILGLRDAVSPLSAAGWVLSASYEQVFNQSPNYAQTGKGFAQRLGAAAARDASEGVFCDSVLAPILREDPRYYRMGPGHNFFKRVVYSGTRAVFTRTDGGRQTLNIANIGGNLGGSVLTQLYYPSINRSFSEVVSTFGGSVGGSALGFLASEFFPDVLQGLHLQKRP